MNFNRIPYYFLLIFILLLAIGSVNALDGSGVGSVDALGDSSVVFDGSGVGSVDALGDSGVVFDGSGVGSVDASDYSNSNSNESSEDISDNSNLDSDANYTLAKSNNEHNLQDSNEVKSFSELEDLITNSAGSISLQYDYQYMSGDNKNGILIDKDVEINGNGHRLNGMGLSRIINLTSSHILKLNDLNFTNANSGYLGGAIYSEGNIIAKNTIFEDNTILGGNYIHYFSEYDFHNGGAVFAASSASFINCSFINNLAENGGALYSLSELIIEDCRFISNTALGGLDYDLSCYGDNTYVGGEGASIYCLGNCSIIRSVFSENIADLTDAKGPGIVYLNASSSIQDSNFTDNNADAAVYWLGDGIIDNCLFMNNSAHDCGGAIFLAGNANVSNCDFIRNYGSNYGGAIYSVGKYDYDVNRDIYTFFDSEVSISNCMFLNSSAYFDGGALYLITNTSVDNCNFSDNSVDVEGFKQVNPYYYYWDLADAGNGGAIYIENGTVSNCRFIDSNATRYGGAIYSNGSSSIMNSSFGNNMALKGDDIYNADLMTLYGNEMNSDKATIFNDNFHLNGLISSPVNMVILENKTYYFNSIVKLGLYALLSDDMGNKIEDYKIVLDIDSFNQDVLFNNATGYYEFDLTNIFEETSLLINGSYAGSSDLNVRTSVINVGLIPTEINFDIENVSAGEDLRVNISLSALDGTLLNGTVFVFIVDENNSTVYNGEILTVDGNYELKLSNLSASNYTFYALFDSNENYLASNASESFEVAKFKEHLIIDVEDVSFGQDAYLNIVLKGIGDEYVDVFVTSLSNRSVKLDNGNAQICLSDLNCGNYTVIVTFAGNEYFDSIWNFTEFSVIGIEEDNVNDTNSSDVNPSDVNSSDDNSSDVNSSTQNDTKTENDFAIDTLLSIEVLNTNFKDNATIVINLKGNDSKPLDGIVGLNVNNDAYPVNIAGGIGSLALDNLTCGSYGVYANYLGDGKYNPSSLFKFFKINKIATNIQYDDMETIAVNVNVDGRIGDYFTVVLKDSNNLPLVNKEIKIGFNGKIYNRTTDEKGSASLQINLPREDVYTFAIAFLGDENYNGSFAVAKITVKKQIPKLTSSSKTYKSSAKSKTLTATLLSGSSKPISGKVLTFSVNGKSYSAKTNSKGVATVKVSLSTKKTYSFTVKLNSDSTYASVSKSAKLIIK